MPWIFAMPNHLSANDPLVIDLDGDGIETVSQSQSGVYFDLDGDFFAEQTGWVAADDGRGATGPARQIDPVNRFEHQAHRAVARGRVVMDRNGNGKIDDITEMFGGPDRSGFGDLAKLDAVTNGGNADGFITVADSGFAALRIWQDLDQDGITDAGELTTLAQNNIAKLGLAKTDYTDFQTPQGTTLFARGDYVRADGTIGKLYDAGFETNATDTIYRGERGVATNNDNTNMRFAA
jgi:hypothetical protein